MRTFLLGVLTVLYPALVYYGASHFQARWLALLLVGLALARALATRERYWLLAAFAALALAGLSALSNQLLPLKLYPVLVNSVLLVVFAASLRWPPSIVEKLARLSNPNLPDAAVAYTRRVTQVWCGFFIFNGTIALWTALYASAATWALYNGLIAYVLVGCLFAIEFWVRKKVQARHAHD